MHLNLLSQVGNDDVFRQDTITSGISNIREQDCSMRNNVQPFELSDQGTCDYDSNIDPVNSLYNNVLLNCK